MWNGRATRDAQGATSCRMVIYPYTRRSHYHFAACYAFDVAEEFYAMHRSLIILNISGFFLIQTIFSVQFYKIHYFVVGCAHFIQASSSVVSGGGPFLKGSPLSNFRKCEQP